jgi:hypothetical protein
MQDSTEKMVLPLYNQIFSVVIKGPLISGSRRRKWQRKRKKGRKVERRRIQRGKSGGEEGRREGGYNNLVGIWESMIR